MEWVFAVLLFVFGGSDMTLGGFDGAPTDPASMRSEDSVQALHGPGGFPPPR